MKFGAALRFRQYLDALASGQTRFVVARRIDLYFVLLGGHGQGGEDERQPIGLEGRWPDRDGKLVRTGLVLGSNCPGQFSGYESAEVQGYIF